MASDLGWLDAIARDTLVFVVAERLMMYLHEKDGNGAKVERSHPDRTASFRESIGASPVPGTDHHFHAPVSCAALLRRVVRHGCDSPYPFTVSRLAGMLS